MESWEQLIMNFDVLVIWREDYLGRVVVGLLFLHLAPHQIPYIANPLCRYFSP